ncbi:MAG: GTP-binding protein [Planctomycetota bacterium]
MGVVGTVDESAEVSCLAFQKRFGDRAQTLVFIGQHLDEAAVRARLESCFVEEAVLDAPGGWSGGPNPFPAPKMAVPADDEG